MASKMAWRIRSTFIRTLQSLKNCTLIDCFCPKHIMFQPGNFRGIICHVTEAICKILKETDSWFEICRNKFA